MKVGDYVRTYHLGGSIEKIIEIVPKERTDDLIERYITDISAKYMQSITAEQIIKSSPNIIDLIEAGDYVNGYRITTIGSNGIYAEDENGYLIKMFTKEDIKSIVTKERFESMEYKVGE